MPYPRGQCCSVSSMMVMISDVSTGLLGMSQSLFLWRISIFRWMEYGESWGVGSMSVLVSLLRIAWLAAMLFGMVVLLL